MQLRVGTRKGLFIFDRVAASQRIGAVGSTGRSTGPHLHYEVRTHGRAVNPITFIQTGKSVSRYM